MPLSKERALCIDNLLVRIHFIIVMIRWTGLAPWEFEFPFSGFGTDRDGHDPDAPGACLRLEVLHLPGLQQGLPNPKPVLTLSPEPQTQF